MKEIKAEGVDLFLSNGAYEELQERFKGSPDINGDIASYLSEKVDDLFHKDKKFQKYIEMYSEISGLSGFAMLEAEGEVLTSLEEGYRDDKRAMCMQRWIDEQDGKYACLFLCVLGINEKLVKSSKSLLFIPDYGVSDRVFYLYSPIYGIIDGIIDSNLIESSLKELEGLKGSTLEEVKKIIEERRLEEWLRVSGLIDDE